MPPLARMAELVDARDSNSRSEGSVGSIPIPGTTVEIDLRRKALARGSGLFYAGIRTGRFVPQSALANAGIDSIYLTIP